MSLERQTTKFEELSNNMMKRLSLNRDDALQFANAKKPLTTDILK
jgi:hypothetical protein